MPQRGIDRQALLAAGSGYRDGADANSAGSLDGPVAEELREQVRKAIVEYLNASAGHSEAWRVSYEIADRQLAQLQLATSTLKCTGGSAPWTGRQRFLISFSTAGGEMQIPLYTDVTLATQVVMAIRPIERGSTLTAADVELRTVEIAISSELQTPVVNMEAVIGMEAKSSLQAGQIVFTDQVQSPILVKRGDVIAVSSRGRGIRVRTTAVAREDGARGELVQVESLETKKRYEVRVVGSREAAVFTAPPLVANRLNPAEPREPR
jgi:flagella basal body P-ring formation protein FlgA